MNVQGTEIRSVQSGKIGNQDYYRIFCNEEPYTLLFNYRTENDYWIRECMGSVPNVV